MKKIIMLVLAAIFMLACAIKADEPAATTDVNVSFADADKELNRVYKEILEKYKGDKLFLDKLKEAQKLWVKYRDAHIESRYPLAKGEDQTEKYGSASKDCIDYEMSELTAQRTKALKMWLKGVEEGETCQGSYHRAEITK